MKFFGVALSSPESNSGVFPRSFYNRWLSNSGIYSIIKLNM